MPSEKPERLPACCSRADAGCMAAYIWATARSMKLNELKISLVQQILHSEDADELRTVDELLNHGAPFELSAKEKAELDKDFADYKAGKGRNYTWNEVKAHARKRA